MSEKLGRKRIRLTEEDPDPLLDIDEPGKEKAGPKRKKGQKRKRQPSLKSRLRKKLLIRERKYRKLWQQARRDRLSLQCKRRNPATE